MLTWQDFHPYCTTDRDLMFTFSSNILDCQRSLSSYLILMVGGTKNSCVFVTWSASLWPKKHVLFALQLSFCCETCVRGQFVASPSSVIFARILASSVWKIYIVNKNAISMWYVVATHQASRSFHKISFAVTSMSQWFLSYIIFIVAVLFLLIPFMIIWAFREAGGRNTCKPSTNIKELCFSWSSTKSNESSTKISGFRPNWNLILRSFRVVLNSTKHDSNAFFKVLLLFSHLLNSEHPAT